MRIKKIETFWLVLNDQCNNRCQFCYLRNVGLKSGELMDLRYAKDLSVKMGKAGVRDCILIGGEPTLYPDLVELIGYMAKLGISLTLVTNGRRLADSEYTSRLRTAGLDTVVISVEGWDEESHNRITGAVSFQETKAGVKTAVEVGLRVETLTTVSTLNYRHLKRIYSMLSEWGVDSVDFNFSIPQLDSLGRAKWGYTVGLVDAVRELEKVYVMARKGGGRMHVTGTVPICLFKKRLVEEMIRGGRANFGCHMYQGSGIVFGPGGDILPCTHWAGFPVVRNNLADDGKSKIVDFRRFWSEGAPSEFKKSLWKYPSNRCVGCEYWGYCVGGCPLLWIEGSACDMIPGDDNEERS